MRAAATALHAEAEPAVTVAPMGAPEPVVEIAYGELRDLTPTAVEKLRRAFVGPRAYGAVAVTGIPGYGSLKEEAFRKGVHLALLDAEGRQRAAAVNNTYPGWSGTPGAELP